MDDFLIRPADEPIEPLSSRERAAWAKEDEREQATLFIAARAHVTGEWLEVRSPGESPDFVVRRLSGSYAGLELTRVYFNAPDPQGAVIQYDWSRDQKIVDEISFLISMKAEKRISPHWRYRLQTILVLLLMDVPFGEVAPSLDRVAIEDCAEAGFREIWVADMDEEAIDAFGGDIRLFGLYPKKWRGFHERVFPHRKPWG